MADGVSNGQVTDTPCDPEAERSNSWPQYAWSAISRKRLEIETPFQRTTN